MDQIEAALRAIAERYMGKDKADREYTSLQSEMDAQLLTEIPADLCRIALARTWGNWDKPWPPSVKFIKQQIAGELTERRFVFGSLLDLRLKLSTLALLEQWNEEARQRRIKRDDT